MIRKLTATSLFLIACQSHCVVSAQQGATPDHARAQQLTALASSKEADAVLNLKQALSDESWYVRGIAASVLAKRANQGETSSLLPLLQDKSWFARDEAV